MTIGRTNHRLFTGSRPHRHIEPNCHCAAYPFPHRPGGGECGVGVSWTYNFGRGELPADARPKLEPICAACGLAAEFKEMDFGIGSYEFWGSVGFHSDVQVVSTCCEVGEGENTETAALARRKARRT